jgi:hypothetical protein
MDDVIDTLLSTFEIISLTMTIGGGVVDGGHVITRTVLGICSKWEIIVICAHIMNLVIISLQIFVDEYQCPS